jgi:hypothetical protein
MDTEKDNFFENVTTHAQDQAAEEARLTNETRRKQRLRQEQ